MERIYQALNRPLSPPALLAVLVLCFAAIFLLLKLGRRQSRAVSSKFLAEHPDAATFYLYAQDLPQNKGEVECVRGTASRLFDGIDLPQPLVRKGVACHLLPGSVELEATLVSKGRKVSTARFSFEAQPGCSYGAVFSAADKGARLIRLDGAQGKSL